MSTINGDVSFWQAQLGAPPRRAPLSSSTSVDVCIVGAGLTGLWTAYYLKQAAPSLSIAVLEREYAGFGASGRNGGWLSALVAGSLDRYARRCGVERAVRLQQSMIESVDEVIRVARDEGIDADIVKGGVLRVARSQPQLQRLHSYVERAARWNSPYEMLSASDAAARINIAGTVGAAYSANGAKLQPAKLVRGLAGVVTKSGVTIYEATPVSSIRPHEVATPFGVVSADYVVRATEGFTSELPGLGRRWLPMNSSMIVTAPLADATWDQIGWRGFETLGDSAHTFMYAQRTADDCIAIGGRGVPYRYGSRTDRNGETAPVTSEGTPNDFDRLLPDAARRAYRSRLVGGPRGCQGTGARRSVLSESTGLGAAGGKVGPRSDRDESGGANLARDLILAHEERP